MLGNDIRYAGQVAVKRMQQFLDQFKSPSPEDVTPKITTLEAMAAMLCDHGYEVIKK